MADSIKRQLKLDISEMQSKFGIVPCLPVILVGICIDSSVYIRMKHQVIQDIGINFILKEFPDIITQNVLLNEIIKLNNDVNIHGLIIQLPLRKYIDEQVILNTLALNNDIYLLFVNYF